MSLLLFRVLPTLGFTHSIMVLSATCIFPAINRLAMSGDESNAPMSISLLLPWLAKLMDVLALLSQFSALSITVLFEMKSDFMHMEDNGTSNSAYNKQVFMFVRSKRVHWESPLALVLVSLQWWENFLINDLNIGCLKIDFKRYTFHIQESRVYLETWISIWKIVWTVGFAYLLNGGLVNVFNGEMSIENGLSWRTYISTIVHIISAMLCCQCSLIACQLKMQRFSFALPLSLVSPIIIIAIYTQCRYGTLWLPTSWLNEGKINDLCAAQKVDPEDFIFAAFWNISMFWIGRHVWYPTTERLAKSDK